MKKVSIAEVISALECELVTGAVLIGKEMDAKELGELYYSTAPGDRKKIDELEKERNILYFFGADDCPVLAGTQVEMLVKGDICIVKLI